MTNNSVIAFQPVSDTAPLSETARAAISKTVLQFYVQNQPQEDTAEGLTALYERLSQEDGQEGESNSIANQKKILERYARDHGYTGIRHYEEMKISKMIQFENTNPPRNRRSKGFRHIRCCRESLFFVPWNDCV